MGPSGTGKTTLLQLMTRQLRPDRGQVFVDGTDIGPLSRTELYALRRRFGVLFQNGALLTDMSVFENVAFPLREHTNLGERLIRNVVLMKLHAVGLRGAAYMMPSQLSGGMARRVALARAIVMDPALLIYDEPFVGLDPISMGATSVFEIVRRYSARALSWSICHKGFVVDDETQYRSERKHQRKDRKEAEIRHEGGQVPGFVLGELLDDTERERSPRVAALPVVDPSQGAFHGTGNGFLRPRLVDGCRRRIPGAARFAARARGTDGRNQDGDRGDAVGRDGHQFVRHAEQCDEAKRDAQCEPAWFGIHLSRPVPAPGIPKTTGSGWPETASSRVALRSITSWQPAVSGSFISYAAYREKSRTCHRSGGSRDAD